MKREGEGGGGVMEDGEWERGGTTIPEIYSVLKHSIIRQIVLYFHSYKSYDILQEIESKSL